MFTWLKETSGYYEYPDLYLTGVLAWLQEVAGAYVW